MYVAREIEETTPLQLEEFAAVISSDEQLTKIEATTIDKDTAKYFFIVPP
jgi:hypothetical protein